jgi:hypothetical protein
MESNESIRAFATPGPLAPHLTRPQSQPPRTPPANPLEGGLTTTCARPFGLEAQAQRGRSLVLRLRLASWGDRELVVERTAECEGEVARARPLGRQGDDGQLEPIDRPKPRAGSLQAARAAGGLTGLTDVVAPNQ